MFRPCVAHTEYEAIAPHTSFRIGGPARWLAEPATVAELQALVRQCGEAGVPLYRLGRGANLLVSDDGVDGVVVRLTAPVFRSIQWPARASDGEPLIVRAGGGTDLRWLTRESIRRGLAGLECLAGIPGTLGGTIRMNAGGRYGQMADVVRDITVVEPDSSVRLLTREQVGFGYRRSAMNGAIVVAATLDLQPEDPERLQERYMQIWREKSASQPLAQPSAGCVFKNPPGHSAGALIDRAGLKGRSVGRAFVSPRHANFIVAREGATARDVLDLIGLIRREVAERFSLGLELEIELWGHPQRAPEVASCDLAGVG